MVDMVDFKLECISMDVVFVSNGTSVGTFR